jgi:exonuclease III
MKTVPNSLRTFIKQLETLGNDSVIIGGDFNVPLDYSSDTKLYRNNNNQKARERVLEMISEHDLVDVWRENNPSLSRFTWHGPHGKQARLDYFLISSSLQVFTVNADIGYAYRSDHSPVEISFKYVEQQRGRGSWKFNNSLLYDKDYVQLIK